MDLDTPCVYCREVECLCLGCLLCRDGVTCGYHTLLLEENRTISASVLSGELLAQSTICGDREFIEISENPWQSLNKT